MENEMKTTLITTIFIVLTSLLMAQEGPAYQNTKRVLETKYQVSQKHGKNVLRIASKSVGHYDSTGTIVSKMIYKGNMTYMGKELINYNGDIREKLSYNYMNLLSTRIVSINGEKERELTEIEYDAKGKILHKTNYRVYDQTGNLWQTDYSQLGYAAFYDHLRREDGKIVALDRYNYFDDIVERHFYLYDDADHLVQIYALNPSDSLVFRTINVYDERGNLIEEKFHDRWDNNYQSIRYFYDDQNRLIQKSRFDWDPRFAVLPLLKEQSDYEFY
jgi:hypothetical protein